MSDIDQHIAEWLDGDEVDSVEEFVSESSEEVASSLLLHGILSDIGNRDETKDADRMNAVLAAIRAERNDLTSAIPDVANHLNQQVTAHLGAVGAELPKQNPDHDLTKTAQSLPDQERNRRQTGGNANRGHRKKIAALAACLVVTVAFWWQFGTDARHEDHIAHENDEAAESVRGVNVATFATVIQLVDSEWLNGKPLSVGDRVTAGVLQLESGIVHLRFDSGVGLTLEGPADFEVTSAEVTRLRSGLLTATVPPGAEGFRVDTPAAQVVDLGTAFGIDQRRDGTSTVSVFDGKVEIVSVDDSDKRLLTVGETVQLAANGSVSDVKFASQPFETLWPAASGIAGSTGAFRFTPPWPRRLSRIQSDTEILVLPEGYAGELEEPCPVDIAEPELTESGIPASRRVRSFLLQFNPMDPADQEAISSSRPGSRMRRIEGSITFDRPVIGLIVSSDTLKLTDEVFALRRGPIRPFKRGLELSPPRTADVVSLSEDRHTLTLKLAVFNQFSDHVRVIVDASLGDVHDQSVNPD